jgi:hypothetical protein
VQPGAIIGEAWGLYKTHWRHLLPFALVVYVILGLVTLLLVAAFGWLGAVLGWVVGIVGLFWLQGALVEAVADVRDGRADMSMGETFRHAQEHIGPLAVAGILAGLAVGVGLLLFIVPGLYLLTIWSVLIPVIVLEGRGVMEAFGRSRDLVRGNGWNVFGVIVLSILILIGAGIVLGLLLFWLEGWLGAFIRSVISYTITAPFVALALTLLYYRLVELKEAPAAAPVPAGAEPAAEPPPPA